MSENAFQIALLLLFFHERNCLLNVFDQELIANRRVAVRLGLFVRVRTGHSTSWLVRSGRVDRAVWMLQ